MKNGKNPTNKQKQFLQSKRLNPDNWLVVKDTQTEIVIVNRKAVDIKKTRSFKKI